MTEMKVESHIELITRPMLETMVEETQYLAVFFCKTVDNETDSVQYTDDCIFRQAELQNM